MPLNSLTNFSFLVRHTTESCMTIVLARVFIIIIATLYELLSRENHQTDCYEIWRVVRPTLLDDNSWF